MVESPDNPPDADIPVPAKEDEWNQIRPLATRILPPLRDLTLFADLSELTINPGPLDVEKMGFVERDGVPTSEVWRFISDLRTPDEPPVPEKIAAAIEHLATTLDLPSDLLLQAGIITRSMIANSAFQKKPVCIEIDGGPETLRLLGKFSIGQPPRASGLVIPGHRLSAPTLISYRLEYYSTFEEITGRSLLAGIDDRPPSFKGLFPAVLLFVAHVANKGTADANEESKTELPPSTTI